MRDYEQFCDDHGELSDYEVQAAEQLEASKQADREAEKPASYYEGKLPW